MTCLPWIFPLLKSSVLSFLFHRDSASAIRRSMSLALAIFVQFPFGWPSRRAVAASDIQNLACLALGRRLRRSGPSINMRVFGNLPRHHYA
jgi:hypothetical protein